MEIKRILVPLDGSSLAEHVLPLVAALGAALDATLVLLHIVEERPPQSVHGEPHLKSSAEADKYMQTIAALLERDVKVEVHVHGTEENNVPQSIADHVGELKTDMVALCTHGRQGVKRVVWGSIAQLVLRRVQVPVLLTRHNSIIRSKLLNLLVPLDRTPGAERAVQVAAKIASAAGARLHLLSIVSTIDTLTGDRLAAARLTPLSTAAALDVEVSEAENYLSQVAAGLQGQGLEISRSVRRGDVAALIEEAASASSADIIVIATHARAGLDAVWTGSVGNQLAGRSSCPVLLTKI